MTVSALIRRCVPEGIRGLDIYSEPPCNGLLKLDAMESPFGLDDEMRSAWLRCIESAELNRYPHPQADALKQRLRERWSIADSMQIVLGNGSDELIQMIAMMFGGRGRKFLSLVPAFSMYERIAVSVSSEFIGVRLTDDYLLDVDQTIASIRSHQPACIFIAYPNNPTGNCFAPQAIRKIVASAPGVVVIDEAYHAFCEQSFLDDADRCENILLLRTLSKNGLAGLRIGALLCSPQWAEQFEKVRLPYNINTLSQLSAEFLLTHYDKLIRQAGCIVEQREKLFRSLDQLGDLTVFPSQANFLLVRLANRLSSWDIHEKMKSAGVLVKKFPESAPGLENCLRITVSTGEENAQMLDALKYALDQGAPS